MNVAESTRQSARLDDALAALGPGDSPERSRLLARRANLLRMRNAATGEAEESAEEALAIARRTGGATELTAALAAKGFLRIGSPDLKERKREAEEHYRAAEATGDFRPLAERDPQLRHHRTPAREPLGLRRCPGAGAAPG